MAEVFGKSNLQISNIDTEKSQKKYLISEQSRDKRAKNRGEISVAIRHRRNHPPFEGALAVSKKELKARKNFLSSPVVSRRLQRIYRLMDKKDRIDDVLKQIEQLQKIVKNRPFELARVYVLKARIYFGKNDLKQAILFYNKALNTQKLPYVDHLSVLLDMSSVYLFQNHLQQAERWINQWFALADNPTSEAHILKAAILVEKGQKKEALKLVMKVLKESSRPKESWLALAASLLLEMKRYKEAGRLLNRLTAHFPDKKEYWKQLSAVDLQLNLESKALSISDLAYKLNFLSKEQDILQLASLFMYRDIPLKAARLVQKFIALKKVKKNPKNYEILGDCWFFAEEEEKALQAYHLSAKDAKDGRIFAKIGRIYLDQENWSQAVKHLQTALAKGKVKRPEYIDIALGMAYFNLKQYKKAVHAFEQVVATEAKGQWIKMAREWINYVIRHTD